MGQEVNKFPLIEGILRTTGFYKLPGLPQSKSKFGCSDSTLTTVMKLNIIMSWGSNKMISKITRGIPYHLRSSDKYDE